MGFGGGGLGAWGLGSLGLRGWGFGGLALVSGLVKYADVDAKNRTTLQLGGGWVWVFGVGG